MINLLNLLKGHQWGLKTIPSPNKGKFSRVYNCGTMLAYDYLRTPTGEESYMQVVRHMKETDFENYCEKLVKSGFKKLGRRVADKNIYCDFEKGGKLFYVYYTAHLGEIRVIEDAVSTLPQNFSYSTDAKGKIEVFQYALLYDDNFYKNGGAIEQCGMNYVIKLADGKVFIIDGGMYCQSSDSAIDGYWEFLKDITGIQNGEKLKIACWFCTHAHNDHMQFFYKFLTRYSGNYELERFMYNFPSSSEVRKADEATYTLQMRLKKYATNAVYVKPHTGQHFCFGGLDVDIMYTHEDCFNAFKGAFQSFRFNNTSTVLKLGFADKVCHILGDIDIHAANLICDMYSEKTLRSDIVQIAHHGFNMIMRLYNKMHSKIYFFPQSEKNARNINFSCKQVLNYLKLNHGNVKILFARDETFGISFDDNGEMCISSRPYIGEPMYYDGSPI